MRKKIKILFLAALLVLAVTGCSGQEVSSGATLQTAGSSVSSTSPNSSVENSSSAQAQSQSSSVQESSAEGDTSSTPTESSGVGNSESSASDDSAAAVSAAGTLTVHFGDDGAPFTMHLYDNPTAAAIADYVGTADWRLPIYNYEGYDNWEVMQYYDLPSRYEIPSNPESITAEQSGEVFYSEPNRIVLFYGDGAVSGEYTRVGYFDATEEFVSAVRNNPVLEGWGNKIVLITE